MKNALLFISINILSLHVLAQQNKIDSLLRLVMDYKAACTHPCIKDSTKVNLLNDLGRELLSSNSDSALNFFNQALHLSETIHWQIGIGNSYFYIGYFQDMKGDNFLAMQSYLKSLDVWKQLEKSVSVDHKRIRIKESKVLNNIGGINLNLGNYSAAIDYYFEVLKINDEVGSKDAAAFSLASIANIYRKQNDYKNAIDYYTKALEVKRQSTDSSGLAGILNNMGSLYFHQNNYSKALDLHLRALTIDERISNKQGIARDLNDIGNVYNNQNNYAKAFDYYSKSLEMTKEIGDQNTMATALLNLGNVYKSTGKYPEAEKYFFQALALSNTIGDMQGVMEVNQNFSDLYSQTHDYKRALESYKKAMAVKDSLFNDTTTKEIMRKEMSYNFEVQQAGQRAEQEKKDALAKSKIEKEKVIRNAIATGAGVLLLSAVLSFIFYKRRRDAIQAQKVAELHLQVAETEMKALRSQMNPHFIFNALQSIQTFLLSKQSTDANNYLIKFSMLMRLVLKNSAYREVVLKEDLEALELYMQLESIRLLHPFTYQIHIDSAIDLETETIPPLILQPFVENAIWHGLQYRTEPGHINIFISKKDNTLFCVVEDNGIGRVLNKKIGGLNLLKKESMGIKLTEERLRILNKLNQITAEFKIIDLVSKENKPEGTRVELSIPVAA